MVKPTCSEVRVDSGMRPVMGTDALAWHRRRLAGGSFANTFGATQGPDGLMGGSIRFQGKGTQGMDER